MAHSIFTKGHVALLSRSATNCYETASAMTKAGLGQSTCVGVGGDLIPGSGFRDLLPLLEEDRETEAIVLIGEIGGNEEEDAADVIAETIRKPVVAFIAGKNAPVGRSMGHAGAIIGADGSGSAVSKEEVLRAAGAHIANSTDDILPLLRKIL
jgi:succinyl-CoA synthetase alpha subunit